MRNVASCLCLVAVFAFGTAAATTVAAVTTRTSAVIGVDSAASGAATPYCKLVAGNGIAAGLSGLIADKATGLDLRSVVKSALARERGFDASLHRLLEDVELPLQRSISWGYLHAQPEYQQNYEGKLVFAMLVIGMNRDVPSIAFVSWKASEGKLIASEPKIQGINSFNAIGSHEHIQTYIQQNPEWTSSAAEQRVTKMLSIESKANSREVRRPFSIVRIDTGGLAWVMSGACHRHE